MDIKIDIDFGKINTKCKKAVKQGQKWLDNEIIADCQPYLPFLEGDLQKSTMGTVIGSGEIIYNVPYANRLYNNPQFNFTKTFHPLAGANWFDKAKAVNKDKWVNGVQEIINKEV